jgi:hypothetical protein
MSILRRKPKRGEAANDYVLPEEKLKQRELAFALYRNMGKRRSFPALERELKRNHPEIAVSRQSLEKWAKMHQWAHRVTVYDQAAAAAQPQQVNPDVDPNFDQVASLLGAANQAIMRAMSATPAVTKPSDVKALVDSAANALKLIETIKTNQTGKVSRQEVANEMTRILDLVEKARRHDVELLVEEAMKSGGWVKIEEVEVAEQVEDAAPVQVDAVPIEADEPDIVDGEPEPEPAAAAEEPEKKNGMRLFTDVLKTLKG